MKNTIKLTLAASAVSLLTACGSGDDSGAESANSNIVNYNYAQHNGSYRCRQDGTGITVTFNVVFTNKSVSFAATGAGAGLGFTYDDKVGLIEGKPY